MASTVVNSTKGRGNGAGPFASGSFNSTTGNAIVVSIREAQGQADTLVPTDNVAGSPNTYTLIGIVNDTVGSQLRQYRCNSIVGRVGHIVSVGYSAGSGDPSFGVVEIAGSTGYSAALSAVAAKAAQPWTQASGTPLAVGDLAIGVMSNSGSTQTITWAGGFTKITAAEEPDGSSWWPGSMAQATSAGTGALTPSCTSTSGTQAAFGVLIFPAAGGGGGTAIDPGAGSVAIAGHAPTVEQPHSLAPGAGAITLAGHAPTIAQPHSVAPGAGALALTGHAPTIAQPHAIGPGAGAITITGFAPTVTQTGAQNVAPGAGAVVLTGYAPTVTQGTPAPAPSPNKGFEMGGAREVSFKPLLQRILDARAERRVKPAKERAQKRAKAIEVEAARLVLEDDGAEQRFRELMAGWMAQRPVLPPLLGQADPMQVFMAQVAFRIQQMQAEEQARARLAAQDEEDALMALLLA